MTSAGHVVVACDKFKGSLTAAEVVAAIRAGVAAGAPGREVRSVLVADGGDGTLAAAESVGFEHVAVTVAGPTGVPVVSGYAVRDGVAVVEMADCCGIVHLPGGVKEPLTASSRGLGEMVRAALDDCGAGPVDGSEGRSAGESGGGVSGAGASGFETHPRVRQIILGIGGSASTDGGAGMLAALGARFLDAEGAELPDGGGALADLASVDLSGLHPRLADVPLTLASDVTNPLLGERGTVAIFAPQKGAGVFEQAALEAALGHFAALVTEAMGRDDTELPGAGAAGGVGYAALAVLGAQMRHGVEIVLDLVGFDDVLRGASLVITGEGSLDRQTLLGKTPAGVAAAARAHGIPVVAVCGRALLDEADAAEVAATGIERVYALSELEPDPAVCMRDADRLLRELASRVASEWLAEDGVAAGSSASEGSIASVGDGASAGDGATA
ncbi:MAG: glycerate kinase [Dermatophilaceae bacterium]|nr:glycerate kinase [Actinomycetales bacterium]